MEIHSKYRQKEKIIKIKLNISSNIFLLICVKALEKRKKHEARRRENILLVNGRTR